MQDIQREPIAIIGIGCRFPGADSPQQFWQSLREGRNAIREVPPNRWHMDSLYDADPIRAGKTMSRWGAFVDNVDRFDWRVFRILPREARYIDPQHRLLLEVTWEAFEDAGLPLQEVAGSQTSVFVGISWNDYLRLQSRNWSQLDGYSVVGNPFSFAANRLSYMFDLRGPSLALDAGCTSSLASIYSACQSLWTGEATLALAGGVNLMLSPDSMIMMSKAGLLSPDGICKALDASADGCVRGEGAGMLILKPLSQVGPSDRVYAVIRGITLNHNGHNEWIMGTSAGAQERLLHEAYQKAGIDPASVDYVELHGTGFLRGDAVETGALGAVLGARAGREHPCHIGSLKTNMGNLEAASGVASVIKVALSLYHRELPPTLNLQQVNPAIALQELHLEAQRALGPWPDMDEALLAGVNTLSFTGANGHAILESIHYRGETLSPDDQEGRKQLRLLPLSAASEQALLAAATSVKAFLTAEETTRNVSWRDICYTASVRRTHHQYRLLVAAKTPQEAASALEAFAQGRSVPGIAVGKEVTRHKLVFLFAHQCLQCSAIEDSILCSEPAFKAKIAACERIYRQHTGGSLCEEARHGLQIAHSSRAWMRPVACFALQVALAELWYSWGIVPDAVLGEGMGEIAAAHVTGLLTLEEAMQRVIQSSSQAPLSSSEDSQLSKARIPFYSTVTGEVGSGDAFVASNWQVPEYSPDLSVTVFDQLLATDHDVFIELGPTSVLSGAVFARMEHHGRTGSILSSLRRGDSSAVLETLGKLYVLGYAVQWTVLAGNMGRCVSLPSYPWQRERIWLDWLDTTFVSSPPEVQDARLLEHSIHQEVEQDNALLDRLTRASPDLQHEMMLAFVTEQVLRVLELDAASVPLPQKKLFELGMDSLTATQLTNCLQTLLKHPLSPTLIFKHPTIEDLSSCLLSAIAPLQASASVRNAERLTAVEELSEAETEALLMEKFAVIEKLTL